MLADDSSDDFTQIGKLSPNVQKPATFRYALLDFIAEQLPAWRNHPDRKEETAETILTSQLCAHLSSVSRHSDGWDILQFRVEEHDEVNKGRKIDLIAAPCNTIFIEGRAYTIFESLMPIECKRLPTPKSPRRDEREYVISQRSSTGGIQRFKAGHHASEHRIGAMIGYIQAETTTFWEERIDGWIKDLADNAKPGWSMKDLLTMKRKDETSRMSIFHSSHERENGLPDIELQHLWIEMS